jgi:hypothetical protein
MAAVTVADTAAMLREFPITAGTAITIMAITTTDTTTMVRSTADIAVAITAAIRTRIAPPMATAAVAVAAGFRCTSGSSSAAGRFPYGVKCPRRGAEHREGFKKRFPALRHFFALK